MSRVVSDGSGMSEEGCCGVFGQLGLCSIGSRFRDPADSNRYVVSVVSGSGRFLFPTSPNPLKGIGKDCAGMFSVVASIAKHQFVVVIVI